MWAEDNAEAAAAALPSAAATTTTTTPTATAPAATATAAAAPPGAAEWWDGDRRDETVDKRLCTCWTGVEKSDLPVEYWMLSWRRGAKRELLLNLNSGVVCKSFWSMLREEVCVRAEISRDRCLFAVKTGFRVIVSASACFPFAYPHSSPLPLRPSGVCASFLRASFCSFPPSRALGKELAQAAWAQRAQLSRPAGTQPPAAPLPPAT